MPTFIDQTGYKLHVDKLPVRIISIVPSQSEFLWDIGIRHELAGITRFCIHPPEMFKTVGRIGGTKKLNIEKIREINPDLIIGNKEENEKEQIEMLRREFNVWLSDIYNFEDAFTMMRSIGEITGKQKEAIKLADEIKIALGPVKNIFRKKRVLYFIWKDPYMVAGANTFIDHVLQYSGLINAAAHLTRYPETDMELIKELKPDVCLLSSEPYPFKQKHVQEFEKLLPEAEIKVIDGEMFSWYGSRLLQLPKYLNELKEEMDQ